MKHKRVFALGAAFHVTVSLFGAAIKIEVMTLLGYIGYFGCLVLYWLEDGK